MENHFGDGLLRDDTRVSTTSSITTKSAIAAAATAGGGVQVAPANAQQQYDNDHRHDPIIITRFSRLKRIPLWCYHKLQEQQQNEQKWFVITFLLIVGGIVIALTIGTMLVFQQIQSSIQQSQYRRNVRHVAFLGNSITFVNDLPRFMEALSHNTIQQNSCLHSSLNFASLLSKGNGMYNKWQTYNAMIVVQGNASSTSSSSTTHLLYDFGACTVSQLILGYDSHLQQDNANNYYSNDGMNPCFQDSTYYEYIVAEQQQRVEVAAASAVDNNMNNTTTTTALWDFLVLNDQTVQPGIPRRRKRSLRVLKRTYAKLLNRTRTTIPVFLSTYGYDKSLYEEDDDDDDDATVDAGGEEGDEEEEVVDDDDAVSSSSSNAAAANNNNKDQSADIYERLGDIPEFTSRIWYGYQLYAKTLGSVLPSSQQPLVVPSALAFLLIWEEKYEMWLQLFYSDGFHPSPHGTYLLGCCLYATIYRKMPPPPTSSRYGSTSIGWSSFFAGSDDNNAYMTQLFSRARRMHMESMGTDRPLPTVEEAMYLASIAKRVVLDGYIPTSLLSNTTIAQMEADEAAAANAARRRRRQRR